MWEKDFEVTYKIKNEEFTETVSINLEEYDEAKHYGDEESYILTTINSQLGTTVTQRCIVDFLELKKDIENFLEEMKQETIQEYPDED